MSKQPFQDTPCQVVVRNNYDTAGAGSLTRSSVASLTPSQLQALYTPGGLYADMDALLITAFEMQACGIKTNGVYEWLQSSRRSMGDLLNAQKLDRGPSLLQPFVMGRQMSVINTVFWAITSGQAVSAYTAGVTGPLTSGDLALAASTDRVIRVVTRYGIDMDPKWFTSRDRVMIWGRTNGVATSGQWKVLASEVDATLSYVDVVVTGENGGSASPFDAAPTAGVLLELGNNVNDFESFQQNRPTLDPRKRSPVWYQTMRRGRRVDSEYMKVFSRLMESNKYYQQFGDLPLAERNRQDEELYQRQWVNMFLFGKAIGPNQTLANWQNLEQITTVTGATVDPGLGGKLVAYRANMIGIREQLLACGRTADLQNNALNIYDFWQENYLIHRARKSQGKPADRLDWYTNQVMSANFETAFFAYMKKEYGDIIRIVVTEGQNELGFHWKIFKPKFPAGVEIALMTHEYFDDIYQATQAEGIDSRGNFMLCLDAGKPGPKGGTIYPATIGSNRKKRTIGELEQLARIDTTFALVMEYITEDITMISETTGAVCECPANSMWMENIAQVVPSTTGYDGSLPSVGQLYSLY
jgi:hypothetical protein